MVAAAAIRDEPDEFLRLPSKVKNFSPNAFPFRHSSCNFLSGIDAKNGRVVKTQQISRFSKRSIACGSTDVRASVIMKVAGRKRLRSETDEPNDFGGKIEKRFRNDASTFSLLSLPVDVLMRHVLVRLDLRTLNDALAFCSVRSYALSRCAAAIVMARDLQRLVTALNVDVLTAWQGNLRMMVTCMCGSKKPPPARTARLLPNRDLVEPDGQISLLTSFPVEKNASDPQRLCDAIDVVESALGSWIRDQTKISLTPVSIDPVGTFEAYETWVRHFCRFATRPLYAFVNYKMHVVSRLGFSRSRYFVLTYSTPTASIALISVNLHTGVISGGAMRFPPNEECGGCVVVPVRPVHVPARRVQKLPRSVPLRAHSLREGIDLATMQRILRFGGTAWRAPNNLTNAKMLALPTKTSIEWIV